MMYQEISGVIGTMDDIFVRTEILMRRTRCLEMNMTKNLPKLYKLNLPSTLEGLDYRLMIDVHDGFFNEVYLWEDMGNQVMIVDNLVPEMYITISKKVFEELYDEDN
jgi:hypothetical protein